MRKETRRRDDNNLIQTIKAAVRDALIETRRAGYLDSSQAATYIGVSLRQFDASASKHIPTIRLTPGGKRLFKQSDLDEYMSTRRTVPQDNQRLDQLVDEVIADVTKEKR